MSEVILSIQNLFKRFNNNEIVKDLSIDIHAGEFITLLGPSGCGKTTTLRLIAGLESQDSGTILLHGKDISRLDPNKRSVNTVSQNYALFPHLNVFDNIGYSLKVKGTNKADIATRVSEMLTLVQMEGYEKRPPNKLSGGQRQRVAIARALINKPDILLLDEPLGALDLKLRQHMQNELKRIQRHTNLTFIYVTHDQEEALNMSSRIAVMNQGRFEQIATHKEIYHKPATKFVAEFVGERNILPVRITSFEDDCAIADYNGQPVRCDKTGLSIGDQVFVAIHSDKMIVKKAAGCRFCIIGKVIETLYTGSMKKLTILAPNGAILKALQYNPDENISEGDDISVCWELSDSVVIRKSKDD